MILSSVTEYQKETDSLSKLIHKNCRMSLQIESVRQFDIHSLKFSRTFLLSNRAKLMILDEYPPYITAFGSFKISNSVCTTRLCYLSERTMSELIFATTIQFKKLIVGFLPINRAVEWTYRLYILYTRALYIMYIKLSRA